MAARLYVKTDKLRLYQVEDELELFDADRASELERLKREKERTI